MTQLEPAPIRPKKKTYLNVIITGESSVGKSWLMQRFANMNITIDRLNMIAANTGVASLVSSYLLTSQHIGILFVIDQRY